MTRSAPAQGTDRYLDFENARGDCFRIQVVDDPDDADSFTLRVTPHYPAFPCRGDDRGFDGSPRSGDATDDAAAAPGSRSHSACPRAASDLCERASELGTANPLSCLTTRERDVALLVAEGHTNSEIAETLCVSLSTVKSHVRSIFVKTDVSTRTALVALLHSKAL